MDRVRAAGALLALAACIACSAAAPTLNEHTALESYDGASSGCYYNFQHYGEGDRIMTNEPCLNCTCHNRMLMCYLRVCPFTKPIGQDCTVEKRADQCCPIVTCPDVPVDLLTSTSTTSPTEYGATGVGKPDKYGCSINGRYFSEGSKVPSSPNKPCEHCYCIRNMTTCVMQECTLHVDGCTPIYHKDVCCPVRYSCDHPEDEILLLDDMTTTIRPTPGFLLTTPTSSPVTQMSQDCIHDDQIFADGALIKTEKACEHCYCMKGDIVCVVQECGTPMENEGKNCTSLPPREGQCCPDTYICEGDEITTESLDTLSTDIIQDELTTLSPPRRYGVEGSGYRKEPDNISYTDRIPTETESEGSGQGQKIETSQDSNEILLITKPTTTIISATEESIPENEDTNIQTTVGQPEEHEKVITTPREYEIPTKNDVDHEFSLGTSQLPLLIDTEAVTKFDSENFMDKTTKQEAYLQEENTSATISELISENKVTSKPDLDTTLHVVENDFKITTDSRIHEQLEDITTESTKAHDVLNDAITEQENPQTGDYGASTSSTPFLEEVEKVTTEDLGQNVVTDGIIGNENLGHHEHVTSSDIVGEIEPSKEIHPVLGDNVIPDTDNNEYIPIPTSTSLKDESQIGVTAQEGLMTVDFTDKDISSIFTENELITTETNRESYVSHRDTDISSTHDYIPSIPSSSLSPQEDKFTTETFDYDTTTEHTRQDDETNRYPLTTASVMAITENVISSTEQDEKVISEKVTDLDKFGTDKYVSPIVTTSHYDDYKTTVQNLEKDVKSTVGLPYLETSKEVSTEQIKYEGSSTTIANKETYDHNIFVSTSAIGLDEDYITTTEYIGKDQEIISQEISESDVQPSKDILNATSTPFLEEVEKVTPEVSDDSAFSTDKEIVITEKETNVLSSVATPAVEKNDTTTIQSDDSIYVTPSITTIVEENLGSVIPEITTQREQSQYETTIQSIKNADEGQTYEMDSKTTAAHIYSTSPTDSYITKEDQFTVTTEPSYRKEDKNMETTPDFNLTKPSSIPETESTTISAPIDLLYITPITTDLPEYSNESQKPASSQDSHKITTEKVNIDNTYTTHGLDKTDLLETTINPDVNEIQQDNLFSPGRIPGEGDCLLNGVTFRNESTVPNTNKCNLNCRCLSSIIKCDPIICSPPPEYMNNCQPTYDSSDSCCPTYVCDQVRETLSPLPHIHITTTDIPKQEHTIECHGDECSIGGDHTQTTETAEICTSDSCIPSIDRSKETSECGSKNCEKDSESKLHHVPSSEHTEQCADGKCGQPGVQVPIKESCKDNNCKSILENKDIIAQECSGDSCRGKDTNIQHKPLCSGLECEPHKNIHQNPLKDMGTYATTVDQNEVSEVTPISTISPHFITKVPELQVTEKDSSSIISNDILDNDKIVTDLPEFVTTGIQQTDEIKDSTPLPNLYITEEYTSTSQESSEGLHSLETKEPIEEHQTKQPSVVVTEDTNLIIGHDSTTEIINEKLDNEQEVSTEIGQIEIDVTKSQDESLVPGLPSTEIKQDFPHSQTPSTFGTTIRESMIDELTSITDIFEVTTMKSPEYSITSSNDDKSQTESSLPIHVSVFDTYDKTETEKQTHKDGTSDSSTDSTRTTENIIEVTQTEQTLLSIHDQDITTTAKYEIESDLTSPTYNVQKITNNDLPHSYYNEKEGDTYTTEIPVTSIEPDIESHETTPHELDISQHEFTEHVPNEIEYVTSKSPIAQTTDSEIEPIEIEKSSATLPVGITEKVIFTTDTPSSFITESEINVMKEDKTIIPLLVSEAHDKDHEKDSSLNVTDLEMNKAEMHTTTFATTIIDREKVEEQTSESIITEPATHFTVSDETQTPIPTFVTVKEDIISVVPVTQEKVEADKTDDIKTASPISAVDLETMKPEIMSSYTTESVPKDETDKTSPESVMEEEKIPTNSPESKVTESVVYTTQVDETKSTFPFTSDDKEKDIKPGSTLPETETTITTLSASTTEEDKLELEFPTVHDTEIGSLVTKAEEGSTKIPQYLTNNEDIPTKIPSSLVTLGELETSISDETRTTLPTLILEDKFKTEPTGSPLTEVRPHKYEPMATTTRTPDHSATEKDNELVTPPSRATELVEHLPNTEETKTTLAIDITTEQTITRFDFASTITDLGSQEDVVTHANRLSTVLPSYQTEMETTESETHASSITEFDNYVHETDESSTTSSVSESENISSMSPSPYVTGSGPHGIDMDESKTTIQESDYNTEKLYSVDQTSHVTESEYHVTIQDDTQTTPTSAMKEENNKISPQASYVTESGTYIPENDETKTTESTQSALTEKETLTVHEISTSESSVAPSVQPDSETDSLEEKQTTTSKSFAEEDKIQSHTSLPYTTESGGHSDNFEEMKTKLPELLTEKNTEESDSSDSNVTDSIIHGTEVDQTRTTLPVSTTQVEKEGSELPVSYATETETHTTVSLQPSSLYTLKPNKEEFDKETPTSHTTESEAHHTATDITERTVDEFITKEESIEKEGSATPVTDFGSLVTEETTEGQKHSTISEHEFTESQIYTTESPNKSTVKDSSDSSNVQKFTTESFVSDKYEHIKSDEATTSPLIGTVTEKDYTENVTTGEEIKLSIEGEKDELVTTISPEIIEAQRDKSTTKLPEADLENEIHHDLHTTGIQQTTTNIPESTYPGDEVYSTEYQQSKSPELTPDTTIFATTESGKIYTTPKEVDVEKPITETFISQQAVTEESKTGTTDLFISDKYNVSNELPITTISHTEISVHKDVTESVVPVVVQESVTSEPEHPHKITSAPESLTSISQDVSYTSPDLHVTEEEENKLKPTDSGVDLSTIKSTIHGDKITKTPEVDSTEKLDVTDHDSSTVSHIITTSQPDITDISSMAPVEITEPEQIYQTSIPVLEKTETSPDVIELEEHTHETILDITTTAPMNEQTTFLQSSSEIDKLEEQMPEQTTLKGSNEESEIRNTTVTNIDASTSSYTVEKSTESTASAEKVSTVAEHIETKPSFEQQETSTYVPTQVTEIILHETPIITEQALQVDKAEITTLSAEIKTTTLKPTTATIEKEPLDSVDKKPVPDKKPSYTAAPELPKPVTSSTHPSDEMPPPGEEAHFPPSDSSGYGGEPDYVEEDQAFGPGTCRYGGKVYVSAQQIPRDDPCDFCFCFRSDIICLQQSCPPPIHGCHEEPIQGFCCPRYECPVSMATTLNVTTTTTTTTTTLPPHFPTHSYNGAAQRRGCQIKGHTYKVGEVVRASSGPCLHCTCGGDGQMKCDPKACTPEPMLRQMIAAAVSAKRRR